MVTKWLLQKLERLNHRRLPFTWPTSLSAETAPLALAFIRAAPALQPLFEEDAFIRARRSDFTSKRYSPFWMAMHGLGAIGFVICVSASILLNEMSETSVAWVSAAMFGLFSSIAGLTGNWIPLPRFMRALVLVWNPFFREPHFVLKLQQVWSFFNIPSCLPMVSSRRYFGTYRVHRDRLVSSLQAVDAHLDSIAAAAATSASSLTERPAAPAPASASASAPATPRRRSSRSSSSAPIAVAPLVSAAATVTLAKPLMSADEFAAAADALDARVLDNFALRFARRKPRTYLWIIGHLLVWIEIVAVLTPLVAMGMQVRSRSLFFPFPFARFPFHHGQSRHFFTTFLHSRLQWVTALCDEPPLVAFLNLALGTFRCVSDGQCDFSSHCIVAKSRPFGR